MGQENETYISVEFYDHLGVRMGDTQKVLSGGDAIPPDPRERSMYYFVGWEPSNVGITGDPDVTVSCFSQYSQEIGNAKDIGRTFSFTKTAGGMVVNNEFSKGYVDFRSGEQTERQYVWECLSAVSDSLGQTICNNVEKYIDVVSNVDMCKVQSLRSMMRIFGLNYSILTEYDLIPNGILDLVNLFSINTKYFLQDGYVKPQMISALYESGVLKGDVSVADISSDVLDGRVFSKEAYHDFLFGIYRDFILEVILREYDDRTYVLDDVFRKMKEEGDVSYSSTQEFSYNDRRRDLGIRSDFDYDAIFHDIESGCDSYDNYEGNELSLLLEIREDYSKPKTGMSSRTRYYRYDVDTVKQYVEFVQNKYQSITLSSSPKSYEHDNNYYTVKAGNVILFTDEDVNGKTRGEIISGCMDGKVLSVAVESLVETTEYIQTLREKLKIQVRKNYMKGTNNLLIYLINEYLTEYFLNKSNGVDISSIQIVRRGDERHGTCDSFMEDIKIVEYMDKTEYMNIQTSADRYSISSGTTCNQRFWDGRMTDGFANSIDMSKIEEFYLSVMNMKYGLSSNSESEKRDFLTGFLDTVYGCGANPMSYNSKGFVNTQIERGGEYTGYLYERLVALSSNYREYDQNIDHDVYSYPDDILSNQISDVIWNYIHPNLSAKYLSAISDVYDEFSAEVTGLSTRLTDLGEDYEDMLSGQYSFYFNKPNEDDYPYSYEDGRYRHPTEYYVSSQYDSGLKYVYDKWLRLQSFSGQEKTIRNYPIIDAVEVISSQLYNISSEFMEDIVRKIEPYGFVDISSPDMTREMQEAESFLNNKITERYTIIQSNIDSVRDSANQLLSRYNTLYQNATNLLANYGGADVSSMWISFGTGQCVSDDKKEESPDYEPTYKRSDKKDETIKGVEWGYNHNDRKWYRTLKEGESQGDYHARPDIFQDECLSSRLTGDVGGIIQGMIDYLNQTTSLRITKVSYKDDEGKSYSRCEIEELHGKMNVGTYSSAEALLKQYGDIQDQTNTLEGKVHNMIGEPSYSGPDTLKEQILDLIEIVQDQKFPGDVYAMDDMIQTYRSYIAKIVQMRVVYDEIYERYQVIYSDQKQTSYLADAKNITDLQFRCLDNLSKYVALTDRTNKSALKDQIQKKLNQYTDLVKDTVDLISRISERRTIPSSYKYSGSVLEIELGFLMQFLENDVKNKYNEGMTYVQIDLLRIQQNLKAVTDELGRWMNTRTNFDSAVSSRIGQLNFFENDKYKSDQELFLNYYGGKYSKYPYYTFQNKEHPSYQIHPFMWNFVESGTVLEDIDYVIYNSFVRDFESDRIQESIYSYIGSVGQTINEWKNGTFDFTGYTTGYESSTHIGRNVLTSEVVDFEGAFFPRALCELTSNTERSVSCLNFYLTEKTRPTSDNFALLVAKSVISSRNSIKSVSEISSVVTSMVSPYAEVVASGFSNLSDLSEDGTLSSPMGTNVTRYHVQDCVKTMISPTFYERFYNHLDMTYGDVSAEIDRLCAYYDEIVDITEDSLPSAQYDIYRYAKDSFGNRHILYKRYDSENPTYVDKQNTLGCMWMRRNNHPFAFPEFTGDFPQIDMQTRENCMPAIYRLEKAYDPDNIGTISGEMRKFFDFGTSTNGQVLLYYAMQTDKGRVFEGKTEETFNEDETLEQFARIEHCAVMFGYVRERSIEEQNQRTSITIYDETGYSSTNTEYIFSATDSITKRPNLIGHGEDPISAYTYVGTYNSGPYETFFVYANREYSKDGQMRILPNETIRIFRHDGDGLVDNFWDSCGCTFKSKDNRLFEDATRERICISYLDGTLTFAYIGKHEGKNVLCCEGSTVDDPTQDEMNSNDVFDEDIRIVKTKIRENLVIRDSEAIAANVNSDVSYYPLYPSTKAYVALDRESLRDMKLREDYLTVQLMGKSRNIDDFIANTNTDTMPYYDYKDIRSNYEYGRVYEDYVSNIDTNLTCVTNGTIRQTSEGKMTWTTWNDSTGGTLFDIGKRDPKKIKVLFQNVETAGKFPYYVGTLDSMYSKTIGIRSYDDIFADEQVVCSSDMYIQTVTGMNPHARTSFGSNRIKGVGSMDIGFYPKGDGTGYFVVTLYADGTRPQRYTSVHEGTLQIVMFDSDNIRHLQKFHMLDTYGIMNAYDVDRDTAHRYVVDTDSWHIVNETPESDVDNEGDKAKLRSYYIDKFGFKRFLKDIEVYDAEDFKQMWIFAGDRNLQFKTEEGLFFELGDRRYYYPSINNAYPRSATDVYEDNFDKYGNNGMLIDRIYDESNVYVLSTLRSEEIADRIGRVSIHDSTYAQDTIRVYEDYLSSSVVDGKTIWNYDKFDENDIDNMEFISCFQHSYENGMEGSEYDLELSDMQVFLQINTIKGNEEYYAELTNETTVVEMDSNNTDLGDFVSIYASYKKTKDLGIELYFNYFNFLDSRFISIGEDGRTYYRTIDSTYLKLGPGEDGILDVCVQVKNHNHMKQLVGEKVIRLASYHIYNLSDDKPKFLMDETYRISKDDYYMEQQKRMKIAAPKSKIDLSKYGSGTVDFVFSTYIEKNFDFQAFSFELQVPQNIFTVLEKRTDAYDIVYSDGLAFIDVKKDIGTIEFGCRSVKTKEELGSITGIPYAMTPQNAKTQANVSYYEGTVMFHAEDVELVLADRTYETEEEKPSLIGILNDGSSENNEIYRVT